jgi:hypothetical protein
VSIIAGSVGGGREWISPLTIRRPDGVEQHLHGCCEDSGEANTTVVPGRAYEVEFNGGVPGHVKLVLFNGRGRWVRLALRVPGPARVTRWGRTLHQVAGLNALESRTDSGYYYDAATSTVHVKLYGNGDWEEIRVES